MNETRRQLVMVVDDEPPILRVLGIKLKISGYKVITASNGREALELVNSASPDIILLDIIMPDTDGFQVLRKLRTYSNLPVIAFSARPENAEEALRLGANDFLAKPFDVDELVTRVRKFCTIRNK